MAKQLITKGLFLQQSHLIKIVSMKKILSCNATSIGNVIIPSFDVLKGEYVGIANPADFGVQWNEFTQTLGGLRTTPEIHLSGRSSVISPPGFQSLEQSEGLLTIIDVVEASGIPRTFAEQIIISLGLDSSYLYRYLPLTPRLLLDLRVTWAQEAELVVFATAGLDPSGMVAVANEVSSMLGQFAAIHVFSAALIQHYESRNSFDKVIHCKLSEDM